MLTHRSSFSSALVSFVACLALIASACGDDSPSSSPDAGSTSKPPLSLARSYALRSTFSLAAPPPHASAFLAELAAATDGPDDPSRYMIDRLVARLPEGQAQLAAAAVAPYLAAYVQRRLDSYAPRLVAGLRALGEGTNRIARRFGTIEALTFDATGDGAGMSHAFAGFVVDGVEIPFGPIGLSDVTAPASAMLTGDRVSLGEHAGGLPYGTLLRQGFDRAVLATLVPGAADLDDALATLVDCNRLGGYVADYIGFGAPALYAGACRTALVRLAADLYARIDVAPVQLTISGSARAVDNDGDGPVDVIVDGTWGGTFAGVPLASSSFEGTR
jgi:hypothetical protein